MRVSITGESFSVAAARGLVAHLSNVALTDTFPHYQFRLVNSVDTPDLVVLRGHTASPLFETMFRHLSALVPRGLMTVNTGSYDREVTIEIPNDRKQEHAVEHAVMRVCAELSASKPSWKEWLKSFLVPVLLLALAASAHAQAPAAKPPATILANAAQAAPVPTPDQVIHGLQVQLAQAQAALVEKDAQIASLQKQLGDAEHDRLTSEKQLADVQLTLRAKDAIAKLRKLLNVSEDAPFDWQTKTFKEPEKK